MPSFHTPTQTPALQYALAVILSVGPTIFTALRFRARIVKRTRFDWDDWLIVVALVFVYVTATFMVVGTAIGYQGRHMRFNPDGSPILTDPGYRWFLIVFGAPPLYHAVEVTSATLIVFQTLYAGQLSQIFAIGPTKISVLLFYRRIFSGKLFHLVTWMLIGLVVGWMIAFFFANLLECVPISEAFVNAPGLAGNPKCINAIPMYLSQVYSDVVLDVLILIIPMPLVWKLKLPLRQKLAVFAIFLLGGITVLASCAKLIVFNLVGSELQKQADISYFLSPITYWPLIEASLQIVAACLTMMRPLVEDWRLIFRSKGRIDSSGFAITHESQASYNGKILVNREYEVELDDLPLQTTRSDFSKAGSREHC